MNPSISRLLTLARDAASHAYNPYSKFSVGCALLSHSGRVYTGCNIESAAYSATICAERVAASQSIAQGDVDWDVAVVVSPLRVSPCGVCRQFLHEFCPDLKIYFGYLSGDTMGDALIGPITVRELLPFGMTLDSNSSGSSQA